MGSPDSSALGSDTAAHKGWVDIVKMCPWLFLGSVSAWPSLKWFIQMSQYHWRQKNIGLLLVVKSTGFQYVALAMVPSSSRYKIVKIKHERLLIFVFAKSISRKVWAKKFHLKLTEILRKYLQNSADFCRKHYFLFNFAENSYKFRQNVAGSAKFVEVASRYFWQKKGLFENLLMLGINAWALNSNPLAKFLKLVFTFYESRLMSLSRLSIGVTWIFYLAKICSFFPKKKFLFPNL